MKPLIMKDLLEKTFKFSLSFKNLTSETSVDRGVLLTNCYADGCTITIPPKSTVTGHHVLLHFNLPGPTKVRVKMQITGKVLEVQPVSAKKSEVTIHFNQFVKEEWYAFLNRLDFEQEVINTVVKKLKQI